MANKLIYQSGLEVIAMPQAGCSSKCPAPKIELVTKIEF